MYKDLIKNIYNGMVTPPIETVPKTKEYKETRQKVIKLSSEMEDIIPINIKSKFDDYIDAIRDEHILLHEFSFIKGCKYAINFIISKT